MKKALALVLALVLALSMAVSAFAVTLVDLSAVEKTPEGRTEIEVIDADDEYVYYTATPGTYYIALEDEAWENVKVTANGCVDAELIKFDPDKMVIVDEDGNDLVKWCVTEKGEEIETAGLTYDVAKEFAKQFNNDNKVTYYGVKMLSNVNVIKVTIADNFSAHYEEGTIKIEATLDDEDYSAVIEIINDVVVYEYEEVKWAAANYEKGAALQLGAAGYSDYLTANEGYGNNGYDEEDLRNDDLDALVVSTTAFRAIAGKNLKLNALYVEDVIEISVTLKEIAAGQKGVNFYASYEIEWNDKNHDGDWDYDNHEDLESISFGFEGNQVVKGAYEIVVDLPYDYYELREAFGLKVEEDDIITYYIVDENGKVVGEMPIDYMTLDLSKNVEFTIKGENDTLGYYTLCLEVPAAESGEENPNTGAESVVGVVAALAVVSVATAAAVSLKK